MPVMALTLPTFQLPISWLKVFASLNIQDILFTLLVSHLLMSWLKDSLNVNMYDMSFTLLTSHLSEMFYHASNFNIENISKWDTSSIETRYMIAGTKGW
jgi:surface protein